MGVDVNVDLGAFLFPVQPVQPQQPEWHHHEDDHDHNKRILQGLTQQMRTDINALLVSIGGWESIDEPTEQQLTNIQMIQQKVHQLV